MNRTRKIILVTVILLILMSGGIGIFTGSYDSAGDRSVGESAVNRVAYSLGGAVGGGLVVLAFVAVPFALPVGVCLIVRRDLRKRRVPRGGNA